MSTKFAATVEFGVKGYSQYVKTFRAETLAEVKDMISTTVEVFRVEMQKLHDKDGDFRAFCPKFANGYPSADFDGEAGEALEITLLTLLEEVVTTIEVDYRDDRHAKLRESLGCD